MIIKQIRKGTEGRERKLQRRHITKSDCLWGKRSGGALGISVGGGYT